MINSSLTSADADWHEQIEKYERLLAELRPKLVEAEADLAEKLAAVNAFEYQIRAHLGHLLTRLELLDEEINALRQKLQWLGDDWQEIDDEVWRFKSSATEEGEYRYRDIPKITREKELNQNEAKALKKLYRDLARRFHPDMALDESDRAYRTQLMMAINAAYAAGDIEKLNALALEPDTMHEHLYSQNNAQKVEALQRELARVKRRLKEIRQELKRLRQHNTSKMRRQAIQMAAENLDFFAEKEAHLREQIAYRKVERDSLQTQIDSFESELPFSGDDFADAVWDVTLEQSFGHDVPPNYDRYIQKRRDKFYYEEDFDDDVDIE